MGVYEISISSFNNVASGSAHTIEVENGVLDPSSLHIWGLESAVAEKRAHYFCKLEINVYLKLKHYN